MPRKTLKKIQHSESASSDQAVIYFRVSSKPQDEDGFSLPAQRKLLIEYGHSSALRIVKEFVDIETAKTSGRSAFGQMVKFLQKNPSVTHIIVEKTDRLYRNFKDYVLIDELRCTLHLVKDGQVLSPDSRSSEKFLHGIKVLMAKNFIDNLSEEVRKGMMEKAEGLRMRHLATLTLSYPPAKMASRRTRAEPCLYVGFSRCMQPGISR